MISPIRKFMAADGTSGSPVQHSLSRKSERLDSADILRGIIMVIMALDHVRDFFTDVRFDPLDLTQTSFVLFITRWITHFCAPVFVFLAGTGAFLSTTRGKAKAGLSKFLLMRGIWLIVLELTWVRFAWVFNVDYTFVIAQVIWVIGWSMIVLAGLIHLSTRSVTIIGLVMILVHNAFDGVNPGTLGIFGWPWQVLHVSSNIEYRPGWNLFLVYPLIPWIGVMAVGYGFGALLLREAHERKKLLLRIGLGSTLAFVLLRASNLYGDSNLWTAQGSLLFTFLDFIDTTKYPPSLLYLLMTLGPAIVLLSLLERAKGKLARLFLAFGRVPMFYYLLHVPLIHTLALVAAIATGYDAGFMFANVPPWLWPEGYGFGLPVVYAVWIGVTLILYLPCKWFAELKRRNKSPWLSYL